MGRISTSDQLSRLRDRERQLVARRRELEAKITREEKRLAWHQQAAVGAAVLRWTAANAAVRAVLPSKLRPFVVDRDWPNVERALTNAQEEGSGTDGSSPE